MSIVSTEINGSCMNNKEFWHQQVSALHVLPVFGALLPIVIALMFKDTAIARAIFGGWNMFFIVPMSYFVTLAVVNRILASKGNSE